MVTFEEVYELREFTGYKLDTEGKFVVPVTWLYVMVKRGLIDVDPKLTEKLNFTDEMLMDMIIDFKGMSYRQFCNSRYGNLIVAYNDWKGNRKWYGIKGEDRSCLSVEYREKSVNLSAVNFSFNKENGRCEYHAVDLSNLSSPLVANVCIAYAYVLNKFSKNVSFTELETCKTTSILNG